MNKVLLLTKCKFPTGDASSKRYFVFSNYFIEKSFQTYFLGMGNTRYLKEETVDGRVIVSFRKYKRPNYIQKILNHLFINRRIVNYAIKHHFDADIIFVDPRLHKTFEKKRKFFKTDNIIYSVVEYYSPSEYKFNGCFSKSYKSNVLFNERFKPSFGKVIAISKFLENHYLLKGVKTVRIPFVVDNSKTVKLEHKNRINGKTSFIYCGNPRSKDNLLGILRAFCLLEDKLLDMIEVNIFGVNDNWLEKKTKDKTIKQKIRTFTKFHGLKPYDEVSKEYANSDFSLLLRPTNERYSMAGFPTKISESLEFGIPPVTNFTSDLSLYLKDLINCIESKGDDVESFKQALIKACAIDNNKLDAMKEEAKKTAIEKLDIRCFYDELAKITGE